MIDKDYCMSSFLMYRRVVNTDAEFAPGIKPNMVSPDTKRTSVSDSFELEQFLRKEVCKATVNGKTAIALSGGIDSAILAKMMPKGSTAYTFKCVADGVETVDETKTAALYAKECGLNHKIVEISWDDMKKYAPILMKHKKSPLHSIEVQIYKAGLMAIEDGFEGMLYGETADVLYGGLSNILSRDWMVGEFIERYAYLKPWMVLKAPKVDFSPVLDYEENGYVNVHRYLSEFDIVESINSYVNATKCAGINFYAPFAASSMSEPLDYERVRRGENKYLIREIFERLYPDFKAPPKLPMPRATDEWLKNWDGPKRNEFIPNCVENLSGDEKWLVWTLERFLNMIDEVK